MILSAKGENSCWDKVQRISMLIYSVLQIKLYFVGGVTVFSRISVLFSIFRAESSVCIIPWSHAIATMAEHSNVTEDRIQSLVHGIVGEFFNSLENGNDQGTQGQEFTSIQSEINQ